MVDSRQTLAYYTYGYGMEARRVNQTNNYLHSDILGSTTAITNSSGSAMGTYEYDPYGILLSSSTNLGNFGFTGQEIDLEIGLYHFPARYYEPYWGRFLTPDPWTGMPFSIGDSPLGSIKFDPTMLNPYTYVTNNPIKYTDPSGLSRADFDKCYNKCVNSPEMIETNEFLWNWSHLSLLNPLIGGGWESWALPGALTAGEYAYKGGGWTYNKIVDYLVNLAGSRARDLSKIFPNVKLPGNAFNFIGKGLGKFNYWVNILQGGLAVGWVLTGPYGNLWCGLKCLGELADPNSPNAEFPPNYD